MAQPIDIGDVVVVKFPFSDLSNHKVRPALVLAKAEFDNIILCQITSQTYSSSQSIELLKEDFLDGNLPVPISYIRPDKIFTSETTLIQKKVGGISQTKINQVKKSLKNIFII